MKEIYKFKINQINKIKDKITFAINGADLFSDVIKLIDYDKIYHPANK